MEDHLSKLKAIKNPCEKILSVIGKIEAQIKHREMREQLLKQMKEEEEKREQMLCNLGDQYGEEVCEICCKYI